MTYDRIRAEAMALELEIGLRDLAHLWRQSVDDVRAYLAKGKVGCSDIGEV